MGVEVLAGLASTATQNALGDIGQAGSKLKFSQANPMSIQELGYNPGLPNMGQVPVHDTRVQGAQPGQQAGPLSLQSMQMQMPQMGSQGRLGGSPTLARQASAIRQALAPQRDAADLMPNLQGQVRPMESGTAIKPLAGFDANEALQRLVQMVISQNVQGIAREAELHPAIKSLLQAPKTGGGLMSK